MIVWNPGKLQSHKNIDVELYLTVQKSFVPTSLKIQGVQFETALNFTNPFIS